MKQVKYRYFRAALNDGTDYEIKVLRPITEDYCKRDAWHYINKQYSLNLRPFDVGSVKGITK